MGIKVYFLYTSTSSFGEIAYPSINDLICHHNVFTLLGLFTMAVCYNGSLPWQSMDTNGSLPWQSMDVNGSYHSRAWMRVVATMAEPGCEW